MEVSATSVDVAGLLARINELEIENADLHEEIVRLDGVVVEMNDAMETVLSELQDEREEVEALSCELDLALEELKELSQEGAEDADFDELDEDLEIEFDIITDGEPN